MAKIPQPTILIIVGVSGDLSRRYLLPALAKIAKSGVLPRHFCVLGVSRQKLELQRMLTPGERKLFGKQLEFCQLDMSDTAAYTTLSDKLHSIEEKFGSAAQRLFYLAVPPTVLPDIIQNFGESGLAGTMNTKLLLEKPFGRDLNSAKKLITHIQKFFKEEQIYRIDHYMAKEMTQNLVVFRSSNALFRRTWNRQCIDKIEIVVSEAINIEGRAEFYEQTGALRDMVQNHLLQLAALTLMDVPTPNDWPAVPRERLKALKALRPPNNIQKYTVRGQYKGYRQEVKNPKSMIETFVSMTLYSREPRWRGVPITLTTGKALSHRTTEIRLNYKREGLCEENELVLRIQPNEGAELHLWAKRPGYDRQLQQVALDFKYRHHFENDLPGAYERVFVDAMRSDHTLFTTSEEVLTTWRILAPIQKAWENHKTPLQMYKKGATIEDTLAE